MLKTCVLSDKSVGNVEHYIEKLKKCNPRLITNVTYSRYLNEFPNYRFYISINQRYVNLQKLTKSAPLMINLPLVITSAVEIITYKLESLDDYDGGDMHG